MNHRKKTNRAIFLAVDISPTFLNTETTNETFQQSGKQSSFRQILKSLAGMYERLGSQFFRTSTGIQSGPDTFDESSLVMTFLTILGVEEIWNFRLGLEGKTGKEIPESSRLEFLGKFLVNNFALSDAEDNNSGLLNRGVNSRFTFFENTISNLPIVLRAKFLGSNGPFCFSSICKFGCFKNPFAMITRRSELYFRFRRFILLVETKKRFL